MRYRVKKDLAFQNDVKIVGTQKHFFDSFNSLPAG